MKELLEGFNQGLVSASHLAHKKEKETGGRESGKQQLPGRNTNHSQGSDLWKGKEKRETVHK